MIKYLVILIIPTIIITIILILIILKSSVASNKDQSIIYNLEGKNYKLLVADEPLEWERGLMFVRKMQTDANNKKVRISLFNSSKEFVINKIDFDGMIFVFPDKQIRIFWNKNTFVDLDVYWIDDDRIIGKDFLPSIKKTKKIYSITSPVPVNKVIEIIK